MRWPHAGHRQVVGIHLPNGERWDLLIKQKDLGMKGTEKGIVDVSGVWVSVTGRKLLSVKVGKGRPFIWKVRFLWDICVEGMVGRSLGVRRASSWK